MKIGTSGLAEIGFDEFVASRSPALLRTAYLLTGDLGHAEDLLQTALTAIYLRWDRMRDKGAAEAYVRRSMINSYTSWWRRRSFRERPVSQLPEPTVDDLTGQSDDSDEMWQHLQALPRQQRAVVVLRFYDDRSVEETAALLRIGTGTVKSHTSRALDALRYRLVDERLRDTGGTQSAPTMTPTGAGKDRP